MGKNKLMNMKVINEVQLLTRFVDFFNKFDEFSSFVSFI